MILRTCPAGSSFFRNKVQPKDVIHLLDQIETARRWAT